MSKVRDGISTGQKFVQCVCSDVVNGPGELMLQCTVCKRWLHAECIGIDDYDKPNEKHFVCVFCGTAILVVNSEENECIMNVPLLGVDNDHVVCCCDEQCESGFMIQCERCGAWQHGRCMNLADGHIPSNYRCHICRFAKVNKLVEEKDKVAENRKGMRGKEKGKTSKIEKGIKLVDTRNEHVYVCKECGQEFDNGQALIYHKTYERCSQIDEVTEPLAMSHQDDIPIDLVINSKDTSSCSKTNNSLYGSPKTKIKQPNISATYSRLKFKSLPKSQKSTHKNLATQSDKSNISAPSPGNENVRELPASSNETATQTNGVTNTPTLSNSLSSNARLFDTIRDVGSTDLSNTTENSTTQAIEDTAVACGDSLLDFEDTSTLNSSQLDTPNCGTKDATSQSIRQSSDDMRKYSRKKDRSIKCLCSSKVGQGVMIQCDICQNWQHTSCVGLRKKQALPTNYCCFDCMNHGCLSIIMDMCKERDISMGNISQIFKDKFVNESRKRKHFDSPNSETPRAKSKKIRRRGKETIEYSSADSASIESDEASLSEEYSSEDLSKKTFVKPKRPVLNKTVKKGKANKPKHTSLIRCSQEEINAIQDNFATLLSDQQLFTHIQPKKLNFKQISEQLALELLPLHTDFPQLEITSNFNEEPYVNSLNYLSSLVYPHGNQLIINSGAPVNTLAWVPAILRQSKHTDTVYLSVTTQPDFDSKDHLYVSQSDVIETDTQRADVVQIWGITLDNHLGREARLSLGIVLKQGKVMDLQWCPSGCFDDVIPIEPDELPRLGLLLVALNTGRLGIVAIPHPASLRENNRELESNQNRWFEEQFFEMNEFDVVLDIAPDVTERGIKCLCCDWSIHSGHSRIVAGFQNGSVAVWNLNAKIFCKKVGSVIVCSPIFHIMAHDTAVMCVVWSPQDPCVFATSSQDMETAVLWDTRQPAAHIAEMSNFQVCVTWCMCWPLTYLRPICGLEIIPKKNANSWYGNLYTYTYRSLTTKNSNSLSTNYPQCPTICSLAWSWEDCSLLLGSFSGELIYLNSFYHARKRTAENSQPRKIFDISFRTEQEATSLMTDAFDVNLVTAVAFDFDYSCFADCEFAEYKPSEVAQEALIKRLIKQSAEKPPVPTQSPRTVQDKAECEKCGKKFAIAKSLNYHIQHDVCKGGTVIDNRGNFFTPRQATPERARSSTQMQIDEVRLEQLKEQLSQTKETDDTSRSTRKSKSGSSRLNAKCKVSLDSGPEREQPKKREKPRMGYDECTQSKIKQVKWFPCQPYHRIFAIGTGLGIITVSAIPGP